MGLSILLTLAFVVGEAVVGYLAHSLALNEIAVSNILPPALAVPTAGSCGA